MSVKLSSIAANLEAERDGEEIASVLYPNVKYTVRSILFGPYETARDLSLQTLFKKFGDQPIPRNAQIADQGRLMAEHILLGWSGFDTPYSREAALETLTDPAYREFVADVELAARKVGKRNLEFVEALVKN